ncbi:ABC transporter permease [Conexibacter stalactiti]|uniref:ABC transporter permease n=1 Tax=Conexibacter stalactiti TaxID=1940611 RepID=A0ABU4HQF6_9ACTN|nr:ABC transporter permease [Conexibacter stalactiti]MDW5594274.1 ABC transporter permease [Conexibacter stalactiti]MEC5034916.1 ABC transporter permease [Conexibacter stalactiti]
MSGRSETGRVIGRRLLQIPLVLIVVSALIFWLIAVVPGNPGRSVLGAYATGEQVAAWNAEHGLDGSTLERYGSWLSGFVRGDWGTSIMLDVPVRGLVIERLENSLLLGVLAFVLMAPVAIALGFYQAQRQGRAADRAITIGSVSLSSMPEFVVGVVLIILFAVTLRWFPIHSEIAAGASAAERLRVMVLPALTIGAASLGYVARMVRAGVIETLASPHYRTAVLKGLPPRRILLRHVARNSLLPTVAVLGVQLTAMLGGVVVVETLFNYPGIGQLILDAVLKKDVFVLEAATLVIAIVSVLVLLATDLAYLALDPRVRFQAEPA